MAIIKKFRIKSFKAQESIVRLEKISMFYNKRQILNNLNLKINKILQLWKLNAVKF